MFDDFLVVRNCGKLSAKFLLGTSVVIGKVGLWLYLLFLARTTIRIRLNMYIFLSITFLVSRCELYLFGRDLFVGMAALSGIGGLASLIGAILGLVGLCEVMRDEVGRHADACRSLCLIMRFVFTMADMDLFSVFCSS